MSISNTRFKRCVRVIAALAVCASAGGDCRSGKTSYRSWPTAPEPGAAAADSGVSVLGDRQSVVYLNPKIPDSALELGVTEQELNGAEILGPPIHQRRLRATKRMRPIRLGIPADQSGPTLHDPGVLACRQVR